MPLPDFEIPDTGEDILESLEEAMEALERALEDVGHEDDSDDSGTEENTEVKEYGGFFSEQLKKYQKEFQKYAEKIKDSLEKPEKKEMNIYEVRGSDTSSPEYVRSERKRAEQEGYESPIERGHKWGCSCPGCSRFQENFGHLNPAIAGDAAFSSGDMLALSGKVMKRGVFTTEHREDTSKYPCGGKLRGERKNFSYLFGGWNGQDPAGMAPYAMGDLLRNPISTGMRSLYMKPV